MLHQVLSAVTGLVVVACTGVAAPVPATPAYPRNPTPAEFAAALKQYQAVGGTGAREAGRRGPVPAAHFTLLVKSVEAAERVPDLPFDYRLTLILDRDTPPGALAQLARLNSLRWVDVEVDRRARAQRPTPDETAAWVAELAAAPRLERLSLYPPRSVPLTDHLAGKLAGFKALRGLVGEGPITDAGIKTLAGIPTLELLTLQACPNVTDAGLAHLAGSKSLRNLGLQYCPGPTAAGLKSFAAAPRLTLLAVGGKGTDGSALPVVAGITTLTDLNLTSFDHGVAVTGEQIGALGRLPRLRRAHLGQLPLDDVALAGLAEAPALEFVQSSDARKVTDAGLKHLTQLRALKTLHLFPVERVTDAGVADLAKLPRLERLVLNEAKQLTDAGLKALAGAPALAELVLSGTAVTESGLRAVAAGRGKALRVLYLREVDVGDEFVAFVAAAAPNLEQFDLHGCRRVTERSLPVLEGLKRLQGCDLHGTAVPQPAMEAFWKRLRERPER